MNIQKRFRKIQFRFCHEYPQYWNRVLNNKQTGGAFPEKIKITSLDKTYWFVYEHDEGSDFYMIYDKNDDERCVIILIDMKLKIAIIENLNGDRPNCPNGSRLMRATMKFLRHNKDKFGINKVVLKDNSVKHCFGNRINFGDMYMLLNGITWYTSYGFLPYDPSKDKQDKLLTKTVVNNKKIIDNVLVKDVINLKKYVSKYSWKGFDVNKIDEMKNKKLSLYLKWILSSYDKDSCTLFYNIYRKIMYDLGIESLHGKPFFYDFAMVQLMINKKEK